MVCPYDLSVPGGVQAQVVGLADALSETGTTTCVVAPSSRGAAPRGTAPRGTAPREAVLAEAAPSGTAPAEAAPSGTEPSGVGNGWELFVVGKSVSVAVNGSRAPVAPGPRAMQRTLRALRAFEPDVVHIHEPMTPGASLAALIGCQKPKVATFHRSGSDIIYLAEGRLLRSFAHRLDAAVAVSEAARVTASHVLGNRFSQIELYPNAVDIASIAQARSVSPARSPGSPTRILFVGRHEERKGLRILLQAFEEAGGRAPDPSRHLDGAQLVVVGEGPQTAGLRARFASNPSIQWLGAVDDSEKMRQLCCADLLVAPSLGGESFGVVLLEAMAAGVPVIASDLTGYRLAAGEGARFVPPGDPSALAKAITDLLSDAHERERLVGVGMARAEGFSLDGLAERYLVLYESVLPGRRRS